MTRQLLLALCCVVLRFTAITASNSPSGLTSDQLQQKSDSDMEALLHSMFFAQLETKALLEELSHTVIAHIVMETNTLQGESEVRKNLSHDDLVQKVERLENKVQQQQQEEEVRLVREEMNEEFHSSCPRDLYEENEQMKVDFRLKEEEIQGMKFNIRIMEEENNRLKTDKILLEAENRQLQSQLRLAEGEYQQQKTEIRLLEMKNQKLEIDVRLLEVRNQQLISDVGEAEDEKEDAEEQLRRVQEGNKHPMRESSVIHQVQQDRSNCMAEVRRLTLEVHQIKTINKRLEEDKIALQNDKTNMHYLHEQENHRLNKQRQNLEHQVNMLKEEEQNCHYNLTHTTNRYIARDCAELHSLGVTESGVYLIFPSGSRVGVRVQCDMETDGGGWTVFLTRRKHSPLQNFSTTWCNYRHGFGDPLTEYWLGNDHLHSLTSTTAHSVRIEAINLRGQQRSAQWNLFSVGHQDSGYLLQVGGYVPSSTLGDGLVTHYSLSGKKFSTMDEDNDTWSRGSCSDVRGGAGWWFGYCSRVNPTGYLGNSDQDPNAAHWHYFIPRDRTRHGLSFITMMIRPNHGIWNSHQPQHLALTSTITPSSNINNGIWH